MRLATSGDYPPFSDWPEGAASPSGFEPALLGLFAAATGRRIEWRRFDWPTLVDEARAGDFDLAAGGITVRPDRSVAGSFGIPLATSGAVVLVAGETSLDLATLDTPSMRIAVNRGGHLERVARASFPRARILPTSPNAAVPIRLERGEVDAVVTDTREAPLWRADRPRWRVLGPITRDRKAVFAAPGHEALLAELDVWLLDRPGADALDALRAQHLGDDPASSAVGVIDALLAAMDERLSLMPDVARFKHARALPVEVPDREARVLDAALRAVHEAADSTARPVPARPQVRAFYRAQIEAAKAIQRRVIAQGVEPGEDVRLLDLDTELRPALVRIGDRIARLVVLLPSPAPPGLARDVGDALAARALDAATLDAIVSALEALMEPPPATGDTTARRARLADARDRRDAWDQ